MDLQLIIHQVMQDDLQLIRQEQARRLAYSVSLTTAADNAPTPLPASSLALSPASFPPGLMPCSGFSSAGPWVFEHKVAHTVAKGPAVEASFALYLHRRSASAIWHEKKPGVSTNAVALAGPATPSAALYPSAMVAPAAYSQQALQLAGVSPAPAIAYGVPTSAPAIAYYPNGVYYPLVVPVAPAVAYNAPAAPAIAMSSSTTCFRPPRATSSKRPAPAAPTAPPPAKRSYSNPYTVFCQERRPFLPTGLRNSARERSLGHMWRELSKPEQAKYKVGGSEPPAPELAPEPAPSPPSAPAPAAAPAPAPAPASALEPPAPIAPAPAPAPPNAPAASGLELLSTAALSMA